MNLAQYSIGVVHVKSGYFRGKSLGWDVQDRFEAAEKELTKLLKKLCHIGLVPRTGDVISIEFEYKEKHSGAMYEIVEVVFTYEGVNFIVDDEIEHEE
jgi:hypothetical protein